jgi:hypothetical protein
MSAGMAVARPRVPRALAEHWRALRVRLAGTLGRAAASLAPPVAARPPRAPALPDDATDARRARARAALAEARALMPGVLGDAPTAPPAPIPAYLPTEAAELRQALRAYTDRVDRLLLDAEEERRTLREAVGRLTAELAALRAELAELRARRTPPIADALAGDGVAALDVVAHGAPAAALPASPLFGRVFPAGSIGVRVRLDGCADAERLEELADRLARDPLVERAEPRADEHGEPLLRLNLRQPATWPELRAALETAAGAPLDAAAAAYARGVLSLRLLTPAAPAALSRAEPAAP